MKAELTVNGTRLDLVITAETITEAVSLAVWTRLDSNKSNHSALSFKGLFSNLVLDDCFTDLKGSE